MPTPAPAPVPPAFVEGFAIVSADGMLAAADGVMPEALKFDADQRLFERGLDAADVVVHGRHSHEHQARSADRKRLIVTHRVTALAPDPRNPKARWWNPAGATFAQALAEFAGPTDSVAIIGGTDVFDLFLDRYDTFWLSRAPGIRLPGGRPIFHDVPHRTPEDVLAARGLKPDPVEVLDASAGVTVTAWRRR